MPLIEDWITNIRVVEKNDVSITPSDDFIFNNYFHVKVKAFSCGGMTRDIRMTKEDLFDLHSILTELLFDKEK